MRFILLLLVFDVCLQGGQVGLRLLGRFVPLEGLPATQFLHQHLGAYSAIRRVITLPCRKSPSFPPIPPLRRLSAVPHCLLLDAGFFGECAVVKSISRFVVEYNQSVDFFGWLLLSHVVPRAGVSKTGGGFPTPVV